MGMMGPTEPGVGGSIGGSPTPTQRELETTAWTDVNKAQLAIVLDTTQIALPEITGGVHRQETTASRPTIAPMLSLRVGAGKEIAEDADWLPAYEELLSALPPEVRLALTQEMQKPFEDQNPAFVALNNVLIMTAKGSTQLANAAVPIDEASIAASRMQLNWALPYIALLEGTAFAEEVLTEGQNFLNNVGPNHPQYDKLSNILNGLGDITGEMKTLLSELENGNLDCLSDGRMAEIATKSHSLLNKLQNTDFGTELQILKPALETLVMLSEALSIDIGSPGFFMGIGTAMTGINGESGIIGENLQHVIGGAIDGVLKLTEGG